MKDQCYFDLDSLSTNLPKRVKQVLRPLNLHFKLLFVQMSYNLLAHFK
jgi:hypothetical protein